MVATEDIWDVLLNERYDLGIGHHYVQPSGLSIEKLSNEPIVFFVAPHSRLAQRPAVRRSDLQRQPLLAPFSFGMIGCPNRPLTDSTAVLILGSKSPIVARRDGLTMSLGNGRSDLDSHRYVGYCQRVAK